MRIYIAGPITNGGKINDLETREKLVKTAIWAALSLLTQGHSPFIPHLNHYFEAEIGTLGFRLSHEQYLKWDFGWLRQAEAVLRLPGKSDGADQEVALAHTLGIPVYTHIEDIPEGDNGSSTCGA